MRSRKAPKLSLIFDEEKRRDYLTGFRKRKLERKKKAREAAEARLAEEIKAIKTKYKEAARARLAGIKMPDFGDADLDTVCSREEQIIGDHSVIFEQIDISNSHYFVGKNEVSAPHPDCLSPSDEFRPPMSLKAALKMNPKKTSKRRLTKKSQHKTGKPCHKRKRS
ncbi:hypothetical protein T265_10174 [Opisthorchis viverrini]|uniref:Nucleolar protein 12 n=2 Tax=Opisthorchis viverrini TaxID=6198 RepID=A0A074Z3D6_OPIVI|nr:hypothetical protein T265_10174 [Opisthorchis viverrini]KER21528.1 hypothetical protein T265_10174 [Opisthorchis viverrini]